MPRHRDPHDVVAVMALRAEDLTDRDASERTGVPVNTIRAWRNQGVSRAATQLLAGRRACPVCGGAQHDYSALPAEAYAYLLGLYLGDGCLGHVRSSWSLKIALDTAYPLIIEACGDAVERLHPAHRPVPRIRKRDQHCVRIESTWKQWICLFPQHGSGRKHQRKIELTSWQRDIVDAEPGAFVRGLIHSDGWRGINRVRVNGKTYEYPRYQFSNRSDDIRRLFTKACDRLGVEWKPWTRFHISVAKRESVALLDTFVGPKR